MFIQLTYLHEHISEEDIPENVWWDEELESYCIHDDADNFKELFSLQFQIGGWSKKINNTWLAQVGYGYPNERVILERRNEQQLHVILKQLLYENDESQFWSFERVRSNDFYIYKPAPPAPADVEELSTAVGGLSVSGEDSAAAAASRS